MQITRRDFIKVGAAGTGAAAVTSLGFDAQSAIEVKQSLRIAGAKETHSLCPYCAVGCAIVAYTAQDAKDRDARPSLARAHRAPGDDLRAGSGRRRKGPPRGDPSLARGAGDRRALESRRRESGGLPRRRPRRDRRAARCAPRGVRVDSSRPARGGGHVSLRGLGPARDARRPGRLEAGASRRGGGRRDRSARPRRTAPARHPAKPRRGRGPLRSPPGPGLTLQSPS